MNAMTQIFMKTSASQGRTFCLELVFVNQLQSIQFALSHSDTPATISTVYTKSQ